MAQININEISQNYLWSVGTSTFATVALPITSSWGPGLFNSELMGSDVDDADLLEKVAWQRFPSTQAGLESFISTYRGPASNYRLANDFSFQMAQTLLAAGYDVLTCRLCPGIPAEGALYPVSAISYNPVAEQPVDWDKANYYKKVTEQYVIISKKPDDWDTGYASYYKKNDLGQFEALVAAESFAAYKFYKKVALDEPIYEVVDNGTAFEANKYFKQTFNDTKKLVVKAKYPGTFGNNLRVAITKVANRNYYNLLTYVLDASGTKTAVENILFAFDIENSTDAVVHIDEIESNFLTVKSVGISTDGEDFGEDAFVDLKGGTDKVDGDNAVNILTEATEIARGRYGVTDSESDVPDYIITLEKLIGSASIDKTRANVIKYKEWLYTQAIKVYELLKDKLSYSPQRIISPGWDDQNFSDLTGEDYTLPFFTISPMHKCLLDVAYHSRCATSLIDVPKSLQRKYVYNASSDTTQEGYAQKLARFQPTNAAYDVNAGLYTSHSALCAPWANYTYVGTSKKNAASPAFLTLMIQRAMILNQASQYEWALPTKRTHSLDIGKFDYSITKKQLDEWQKLEGVGVNILTNIPDMGVTLWGNSTLFEVPPATYQALANLSTRYLVNAVKDVIYRCGIQITFNYNNGDAYSAFYAGVSPILDTMKTVGAITGYAIRMSADVNVEDRINANSIVGKVYLAVQGVVNDIDIDLIALPPQSDLTSVV